MTKEVGTNEQLNMKRPEKMMETKTEIDQMTSVFANFEPTFGDGSFSNSVKSPQQSGWLHFVLFFPWILNIMFGLNLPKRTVGLGVDRACTKCSSFSCSIFGIHLAEFSAVAQWSMHQGHWGFGMAWQGQRKLQLLSHLCFPSFFPSIFFPSNHAGFIPCILFEAKKLCKMTHPAPQLCSWRVPCGPSWVTSWTSSVN